MINLLSLILDQINYLLQVSTTNAHEGSGYSSAKNLQMAWQRLNNVKARIKELEDTQLKFAKKQNPTIQPPASNLTAPVPSSTVPVSNNLPPQL
jgi:hypothetical protein